MYLKSIEIQGFKSFATRIVLDFHDGITGIVGPNGSGKSNIADAVRWVLGEQKVSQLRSAGMQDVIFAGTESRRPVSFAYVAITFDNSDRYLGLDYSEVTVARRVYRSGESEYLLNGTACRRKDIQELFYDTGIGQEGYSIIGQGQIDKILSGKPEERRELFDEAAGIVKFKRRKQTTLRKLESEQQNLVRVTDILAELDRQVGPLGAQAERAREYLKKKDALKVCEVNVFLREMDRVETDGAAVAQKQEIAENQMREAQEALDATLKKYEDLDREIKENDDAITALQNRISENDLEREKSEGRINVLREQIQAIRQSETQVQGRLDELRAEIARREETGKGCREEKGETDERIAALLTEQGTLREALESQLADAAQAQEQSERDKQEVLSLLDARAAMEGEGQRCSTMIEQANIREAQLNARLLEQKSTESDVSGRLAAQQKALKELDKKRKDLEKKQSDIRTKREKWDAQAAELQGKIEEIRQAYHRQNSRLETLRGMAERYDGYGSGIRRVMEKKADTKGICGVVADLIRVDARYETAIETALGAGIQNVVTKDEETAKRLIAYLKENRYGRVTFLPLSSVTAPRDVPEEAALGETGAIGLADTLVETEDVYREVIGHLLRRVLVVDTVDHAAAIAKKHRYSLRIVTLEGESLRPGGSISGGAYKNGNNLLERSREIEALEKAAADLAGQEEKQTARLAEVRTAEELLADDLDGVEDSLRELLLEENTGKVELEHLEEEKAQQEAFYANIRDEIRALEDQKSELAVDKEQIQIRMERSRAREEELSAAGEKREEELAAMREKADGMRQTLSGLNVDLAQLQERSDFSRENIERIEREIAELQNAQQEVLLSASTSSEEIEKRETEIRALTDAKDAAAGERETLAGDLDACVAKKEQMATDHKEFFDKREAMAEEISRLDKEIFRLNDRREKLAQTRETQTEYMWEEYELTRHEAETLRGEDLPGITELRKRIAQTRAEIRELGEVNVNAIEEYKAVSERHEFLKVQYEDLKEAEKNLLAIIADLDDGMQKQFSEKFAAIQKEFDRTFQDLFGGGKGTLTLIEDPEHDLLDCGIGIVAQPPGKKLQNMMQLSGGEKALTAIALLFAIQNLKPSPFCLLDEIEAALDDTNVVRYANYLQRLSKNTQFIVITHRRGTMNVADRLYGVTMQEKGVSALVSVDLVEKDMN